MITLCPNTEDLKNYKNAVACGLTREQMTPDDIWVEFHIRECEACQILLNSEEI